MHGRTPGSSIHFRASEMSVGVNLDDLCRVVVYGQGVDFMSKRVSAAGPFPPDKADDGSPLGKLDHSVRVTTKRWRDAPNWMFHGDNISDRVQRSLEDLERSALVVELRSRAQSGVLKRDGL
jgi:hypothetical protein